MGQGTESCGGYDFEYDPYSEFESDGYNYWTRRSGATIAVSAMSVQHINGAIRVCEKLALMANFTCESDKWKEWISVFRSELYNRLSSNSKPDPTKIVESSRVGKLETKSLKKKDRVAAKKGLTLKLRCWCGAVYNPRISDLKRGWGKSCCKSCSAIKRDHGRPDPTCADTGISLKLLLEG